MTTLADEQRQLTTDGPHCCEEAAYTAVRPAFLVRPTGGLIQVMAGLVGDELILEGDIGLGPATAMQAAMLLRCLEQDRPPPLGSADPELIESTRAFAPHTNLYRRAWQHLRDSPEAPTADTQLKKLVEELDAWRRGQVSLGMLPYGAIITDLTRRWPHKLVPFSITYDLRRDDILGAIAHWRAKTSLSFEEAGPSSISFINFVKGDQCGSSSFGCSGKDQTISLTSTCSQGTIIHELGHAIGLYHEHVRHDRDRFVKILNRNIKDEYLGQFEQYGSEGEDAHRYDYASIMHYKRDQFTKNGKDTIVPKQAGGENIGQRDALSDGDVAAVEQLYS